MLMLMNVPWSQQGDLLVAVSMLIPQARVPNRSESAVDWIRFNKSGLSSILTLNLNQFKLLHF